MKRILFIILLIPFSFFSCDSLIDTLEEIDELSKEQVIEGLKTALVVGTDTSVSVLHAQDGYFADLLIKILLPEDAQRVLDLAINSNLVQATGLDEVLKNQIGEVVLRINRTAEDAAVEAKPIFTDAVMGLSLDDAWEILNGVNPASEFKSTEFDSAAATSYLRSVTFAQLKETYAPKIDESLSKDLVAGISTNTAWGFLAEKYNPIASLVGGTPLDDTLGPYVTERALDGLFFKVADIERQIRKDPIAWALETAENILDIVFGDSAATNPAG